MKKGTALTLAIYLIALIGIGVLVYPIVESRYLDKQETNKIVRAFRELKASKEKEKDPSKISVFEATHRPIGILLVPEIDIILPIYNELSEYALSKGAGAMPNYNDLSGERGSICALSSHNGLSASGLFTNLHKLEKNSRFYIETGEDKIMEYKVVDTALVDPTDSSLLKAEASKAKAVLISCASIEGVNSHRLLVFGEKLGNIGQVEQGHLTLSLYEQFVLLVILILILILVLNILIEKRKRNRQKRGTHVKV